MKPAIAESLGNLLGTAQARDRIRMPVHCAERDPEPLQRLYQAAPAHDVLMAQQRLEEVHRLSVRAAPQRVLGGWLRMGHHQLRVFGADGMVSQSGQVGPARQPRRPRRPRQPRQLAEQLTVQGAPSHTRQRVVHRTARQLVPEGHPVSGLHQQPVSALGLRHPAQLETARFDGDELDDPPRLRGKCVDPGEDRIHQMRRQCASRSDELSHEEGIPVGGTQHLDGVEAGALRQRGDRDRRQCAHRYPTDVVSLPRQVPEDASEAGGHFGAPVGRNDHGLAVGDPPSEELQHRQCQVVAPMDVLQHDRDRSDPAAQRVEQRVEGNEWIAIGPDSRGWSQVDQRSQWARGRQRVAPAPPRLQVAGGRLHQAGLSAPGVTLDQDHRPASGSRVRHGCCERIKLRVAVEQHVGIVRRRGNLTRRSAVRRLRSGRPGHRD